MTDKKHRPDTVLTHAGRHPREQRGVVNPPIYRASTITFPTMQEFETRDNPPYVVPAYGRSGTPTTYAFEEAVTAVYGGHRTVSYPSGLGAISGALYSLLGNGDHILVVDTVYGPTRKRVCGMLLANAGVETTYYDPAIGAGIADLIRPNTKAVYLESPGTGTFEMQDIPAITDVARKKGVRTLMDNTWSSALFCQPFDLGVDWIIEATTKYVIGHSDAMLGTVTVRNEEDFQHLKNVANSLGYHAAPDDCYLGQRGLRTLSVRLERHQKNAYKVASWLAGRPEVARVMYPALESDPGHGLWKRDHKGASSLFGVALVDAPKAAVAAMLDGYELYSMGASWGGYESLVIPTYPANARTATKWTHTGPCVRYHIGLEDPDDLIADLEAGFKRFNAAR